MVNNSRALPNLGQLGRGHINLVSEPLETVPEGSGENDPSSHRSGSGSLEHHSLQEASARVLALEGIAGGHGPNGEIASEKIPIHERYGFVRRPSVRLTMDHKRELLQRLISVASIRYHYLAFCTGFVSSYWDIF